MKLKNCARSLAAKGRIQVRFESFEGDENCVFILPKSDLDSIVRRLDRSALDAVAGAEPIDEDEYHLAISIDVEERQLQLESNEYNNRNAWEVGCLLIRLFSMVGRWKMVRTSCSTCC